MSDFSLDQAVQWVTPPSLTRVADATADLLAKGAAPDPPHNTPVRRWATVTQVNAGPPPTVNITLGVTGVVGVRYLFSYFPAVGDVVIVDTIAGDPLVIGRRANNWSSDTMVINASVQVVDSFSVGTSGQSVMTGDGWYRSYGSTGWYSQTYGCGIYMVAGDNYVRAYPSGVGKYYSDVECRAGICNIGGWNGNMGYAAVYDSRQPTLYMLLSDGSNTYVSGQLACHIRSNNAESLTIGQAFGTLGAADIHFPGAANGITGVTLAMASTGSFQVGYVPSSITFKTDVTPYTGGADNPVWNFQPVTFLWDEDTVANGKDANLLKPNGQLGLVAEHVYEYAPDAVQVLVPTGTDLEDPQAVQQADLGGFDIISLDNSVLIAYLVDAVQHLKLRLDQIGAPV